MTLYGKNRIRMVMMMMIIIFSGLRSMMIIIIIAKQITMLPKVRKRRRPVEQCSMSLIMNSFSLKL